MDGFKIQSPAPYLVFDDCWVGPADVSDPKYVAWLERHPAMKPELEADVPLIVG